MAAKGPALRVVSVGKTRRGPALELEEEFLTRIGRYAKCRRQQVTVSRKKRSTDRCAEEGHALAGLIPERGLAVALDARGDSLSSADFRRELGAWRRQGEVVFFIGGADGFSDAFRSQCQRTISLGRITLPHELALVVLLEQIYRALAAEAGHPYSRH